MRETVWHEFVHVYYQTLGFPSLCVCVKYCAVLLISLAGGILVASSVYKFLAGTTSDSMAVE